ncbi:PIG-L family deacetylase [Alicyclobacillus tolerans]|uniref:PIG-L deacetylase family protein n=1 Tax=Alicyclobacillus tolerans TaxID=90970 RepID=UPI001F42D88C|nr:PIG-L deacetylase family protein [Alicyclobacillus tolerans]MCF8564216.1 PIG-L family deacetylase [Alicyclobacillus tolerans]
MDIRQALGLPHLLDAKRIVCVQPHPDDNEVGAAGTLIEMSKRGCEVIYVTVTDGRAGSEMQTAEPQELAHIRRQEMFRAGAIVGVTKHIELGFPDGGDYRVHQVTERLVAVLRQYAPDVVMTVDPWMPYEAHPDHIKTGKAVAAAVLFASNGVLFPMSGAPTPIPQVAFYATSYPNTYVDITSHWDEKLESIHTHASQFDNPEWPMLSGYLAYQANEVYRSWKKDTDPEDFAGYAEAFKVLATKQLHFFPSALYS